MLNKIDLSSDSTFETGGEFLNMDVYHKVLSKLYEATGGKDSATTDLKDLVKSQGFLGSYNDIFQMLSGQGWIAETSKLNFVKITHWGVTEAKKTGGDQPDTAQILKKEAARIASETKQFLILLEEFTSNTSKENFAQLERKFNEINSAIGKLKTSIE
ncbi:MAG: hypothetical protein LH472_03425 [Pyrinomonadaceae bacterium]|nr:hypothetical protein [Pyrinomonadaceae bacterium]